MKEYHAAVWLVFFFKWNKISKQLNGKTFKTLMSEKGKDAESMYKDTLCG